MYNSVLSVFAPWQTAIIIIVSVIGALLIALNIALAIIFHKRGERKLYDLLLEHKRELLMEQLEEMRIKGDDGRPADIKPMFVPADAQVQYVQVPVSQTEEEEENEEQEDELVAAEESEDDVVIEESDVIGGKVIRYKRSFEARLIQASEEVKARYSALKNHLLSYNGVKSRITWKKESFRLGRRTPATFVIRGKTLCLCLATDPARFNETKYKVIDLSVRSPKSKQPCMYRISSDRKARYAAEMIDLVLGEDGGSRLEREAVDYRMSFESTEQLIDKQLIRVTFVNGRETEAAAEAVAEPDPV